MKRIALGLGVSSYLVFVCGGGLAAAASAQEAPAPAPESGAQCTGGIASDDGSFEFGRTWADSTPSGSFAMRVALPGATNTISAACVCWSSNGTSPTVHFDLNVWAADGPSGSPGTFLGGVPGQTFSGPNLSFVRVNFPIPLTVHTNQVYIGPYWHPSTDKGWFICEDSDGPGGQPGYGEANGASSATPNVLFGPGGLFPEYRAFGIRAEAQGGAGSCTPGDQTLCLSNGRFQVQATFDAGGGNAGTAHVVPLTGDTGYLWFFGASNVEVVIKVLDGCFGGHYWVFAGGLTNVKVVITVTDTQAHITKTYTNPPNTTFLPIQDTSAFATCP
ncbi:MAG TPA: hypothetical protein VHR45_00445 [Thermoanaerobaculia bacterium]|nr:hypothetical protein [Thermoanaerobaculia bacterium]